MKKKFIVRPSILLWIFIMVFAACNNKSGKKNVGAHDHDANHALHKHIPGTETLIDSGLTHLLKPANEQVVSNIATIKPERGTKIFSMQVQGSITYDTRDQTSIASRVSGRIERLLIKYNYQPIRKGELIMEIYSPDLAAAQRELLFIYQTDKNDLMIQKAKQRLLLLGMQDAQIKKLLNTGEILYRIPVYSNASGYILEKTANRNTAFAIKNMSSTSISSDGDNMGTMSSGSSSSVNNNNTSIANETTPVLLREGQYVNAGQPLFTIYNNKNLVAEFAFEPASAAEIKKGDKLIFYKTAFPETVYTGSIGLIQPSFLAGSSFTLARVYLKDTRFQIGELIAANIPVLNKGYWVPQNAVLNLGNRSVVFKKEAGVFIPKEIKPKITTNGMVLIEADISDWAIAVNAAFMMDSESFIKPN